MKARKWLNAAASVAMSGLLAGILAALVDCVAVFCQFRLVPVAFFALLGVLFIVILFCRFLTTKQKGKLCLVLLTLVAVVCAVSWAIWQPFQKNAAYEDVDSGKGKLYADRSVMVIVPHQDDEANILAGVLEEFGHYGSDTRVVFVTNGDFDGVPQVRQQEALVYCAYAGIPEENVIFLGYGDRWNPEIGVHLYNAEPGQVVPSYYGAEATYGMENHPAYRQDNAYTPENYLADMEAVILEHQPELIFCIDYDDHIEHKAVSLVFEKAMGNILKSHPTYRPVVLKGYAYGTAWYAESDFYGINILSTRDIFTQPYQQKPASYRWEDRIRFPVDSAILSRSLRNSHGFRSLECYSSQNAQYRAEGIINGDKVFWQRRTDSLCLGAEVRVSSGEGQLLNDFMLVDNWNLWEQADPNDGAWIPAETDGEKRAEVVFREKMDLGSIVLYDHPGAEDNILNARIAFDDGTVLETGALHPTGAATEIPVHKSGVQSFSVTITQTEGTMAGLGEVEAYAVPAQGDLQILKMTDLEGNFVYDYCIPEDSAAELAVYTYGIDVPLNGDNFTVSCDNEKMSVSFSEGHILVKCPAGESGTIRLSWDAGEISDSIYVRNPGKLWRIHTKLGQIIERYAVFQFRETILFRVTKRIVGLLN